MADAEEVQTTFPLLPNAWAPSRREREGEEDVGMSECGDLSEEMQT